MNIEPAILVMHHSMRSHPAVTATLLDFLCRIITNFYPPLLERVRSGIHSSLRQILDKRVLPSLLPLFDNVKLDRELRNMIRETFKEFCIQTMESSSRSEDFAQVHLTKMDESETIDCRLNHNHIDEPAFSDEDEESSLVVHTPEDDTDDDDIPLAKVKLKKDKVSDKNDDEDFLDEPLKASLNQLQMEKDRDKRYELVETVMQHVMELDEDTDLLTSVAKLTCNVLYDDFNSDIFPKVVTNDSLLNSIKMSVFVNFNILFNMAKYEDALKDQMLKFVGEMYTFQPNIGYLLLYFLKVKHRTEHSKEELSKVSALKVSVYKDFCAIAEKKIDNCLYDDLNSCHIKDIDLMMWIVPDLYKDFKQQMVNNAQILRVIVSSIDSLHLNELICKIMQGRLTMFRNDSIQSLLKMSLSWETIEQFFLWQLIRAHDISIDSIIPLVSHLNYHQHPEAVSAIALMLKQNNLTPDTIKYLFSRDIRDQVDPFLSTMVKYWCDNDMEKLGDLISGLLSTRYPATFPNKRKRNKTLSATVPSADQVLEHLNLLRMNCKKYEGLSLYSLESMQKALLIAQNNSTDSQKKHFNDLFALTEEEYTSKNKAPVRGRKPVVKNFNKRATMDTAAASSDESSEVRYQLGIKKQFVS